MHFLMRSGFSLLNHDLCEVNDTMALNIKRLSIGVNEI